MMSRVFFAFMILVVTAFVGGAMMSSDIVHAQDAQGRVCDRLPGDPGDPSTLRGECERDADTTFQELAGTAINILSWVVGALSVLAFVIAGFLYVISAGSPDKAKRAKNTIIYAVAGLIVAFTAQIIVRFVLNWV